MMKIGILTLPFEVNYGGILQAWALKTVLTSMGHDVEVFSICNRRPVTLMPFVWIGRAFNKWIRKKNTPIFAESYYRRIFSKINHFLTTRLKPEILKSIDQLPSNQYDVLIAGSDQIWRKSYFLGMWKTKSMSRAFFCNIDSSKTKKISYSASFGLDTWQFDAKETEEIASALKDFHAISVREYSATDLLKKNCGIDSTVVLDPTMLLTAEEYISKLNLSIPRRKSGVISYILDPDTIKTHYIENFARNRQLPHTELNKINSHDIKLSIEEWLAMIASADIVITDSFHGCVFSIIFRRPLIFLGNKGRGNARFETLIKLFGIEKNFISDITKIEESPSSFELPKDISERINRMKKNSNDFIKSALIFQSRL